MVVTECLRACGVSECCSRFSLISTVGGQVTFGTTTLAVPSVLSCRHVPRTGNTVVFPIYHRKCSNNFMFGCKSEILLSLSLARVLRAADFIHKRPLKSLSEKQVDNAGGVLSGTPLSRRLKRVPCCMPCRMHSVRLLVEHVQVE